MSYDELFALPEEEFEARLDGGDYRELQAMCKYIGISAGGSAGDLKRRLLEHKAQSDAPVKSPEGRTGRACSLRRAVAAPQSRASAVSEAVEAAERVSAARAASASAPRSWPPPPVPAMPSLAVDTTAQVDPRTLSAAEFQAMFPGGAAAAEDVGMDEAAVAHKSGEDPLTKTDPWKGYLLSTPVSRRSSEVRSGVTPEYKKQLETLDSFLDGALGLPVPLPLPSDAPQADVLNRILEGVDALWENAVTKSSLKELVKLQRAEFKTFVQAETAPIHTAIDQLSQSFSALASDSVVQFDRVGRLETQVEALSLSGAAPSGEVNPNPNDPGLRQIAFKQFPEASSITDRISAMKAFMSKQFPEIQFGMVDLYADNQGEYTRNGFVEVSHPRIVRRVLKACKKDTLQCKFSEVKIRQGTTAIDRARNWALFEAKRLVESAAGGNRSITLEHAKGRGVYVDKVQVFMQEPRYATGGTFLGEFRSLQLPK